MRLTAHGAILFEDLQGEFSKSSQLIAPFLKAELSSPCFSLPALLGLNETLLFSKSSPRALNPLRQGFRVNGRVRGERFEILLDLR
jgi:hypothetical protein